MASRQNRSGRPNAYAGYGALAQAYRGRQGNVNPMMEKYKAQQKSMKGVNRDDAAKARIAKAQQSGVSRGTQEQITRHTTPGGGGYDRQAAIRREKELSGMSEEAQMLHLGRKANPNAGGDGPGMGSFAQGKAIGRNRNPRTAQPREEVQFSDEERAKMNESFQKYKDRGTIFHPKEQNGGGQYGPETPFGDYWTREGEEGQWSDEQKAGWARGESPRQQMARVTGGQAGQDRAMGRMRANSMSQSIRDSGAHTPRPIRPAVQPGQGESVGGRFRRSQAPTGPNIGGSGGFMGAVRKAAVKARDAGPTTTPTSPLSSTQRPMRSRGLHRRT